VLLALAAPAGPCPPLGELLDRAGRYVLAVEQQLTALVGNESYSQLRFLGRQGAPLETRKLESEVAWVATGDPMVWAFYRDVLRVDGKALGDRGSRLEQLFPSGSSLDGRAQAQAILAESARYNLGSQRTLNVPTLALSLLHPRNRERLSFALDRSGARGGAAACTLSYRERRRPTLIATARGKDLPARGKLVVEPSSGAVVTTRLSLEAPGLGPVMIETTYARDAALGYWLPARMTEEYGYHMRRLGAEERIEADAVYSGWRRAHVEIDVVLPKP
jgi:hypothetical protein